jgi:predicted porin
MKRTLLATAAMMAFAGVASAQSSVNIGGIIDVAARSVSNPAGSIKSLSPDGLQTSRLIFRGVEDLGGGMRASFHLESPISIDDGNAAGVNWTRRSTVSLTGGFGEIRLGRDYTSTFWTHVLFDPFNLAGVASQANLMSSTNMTTPVSSGGTTLLRASNMIGYFLPANLGGIYGQLNVAAGEGATGNKYIGGRLGYASGPFDIAFAYGITDKTGTMLDDLTAWNLGASYNLGFVRLMGQYHSYKYNGREFNNAMIGGVIPVGANNVKFSYAKAGDFRQATQLGLGYQHNLSKRTALYTNYSRVSNKAGANFTASNRGPGVGTATGFNSTGYEFGVRHSF